MLARSVDGTQVWMTPARSRQVVRTCTILDSSSFLERGAKGVVFRINPPIGEIISTEESSDSIAVRVYIDRMFRYDGMCHVYTQVRDTCRRIGVSFSLL